MRKGQTVANHLTRGVVTLCLLLFTALPVRAMTVYGVSVDNAVTMNGQTLQLNGFGLRTKWFFKIYVGAFYVPQLIHTSAEAVRYQGDRLIRLHFVYSKVSRDKVLEALNEAFENNSPGFTGTADARQFRSWFSHDFLRGDQLDLALGADSSVVVTHNGRLLGSMISKPLQAAIMRAFFGVYPADEALKRGMLGML